MNKADEEQINHSRAEWKSHPYTRLRRHKAAKEREDSMEELKAVCAVSGDPRVAKAFGQWKMWDMIEKLMGGDQDV